MSSQLSVSGQPMFKRQRVSRACQTCRLRKAKCDGRQPVCSRCEGYGHECLWSQPAKRHAPSVSGSINHGESNSNHTSPSTEHPIGTETHSHLVHAVLSYERLLADFRHELGDSSRSALDERINNIEKQLQEHGIDLTRNTDPIDPLLSPGQSTRRRTISNAQVEQTPRYLGESSDVRFFHTARQILQDESKDGNPDQIQNYDEEKSNALEPKKVFFPSHLPPREDADKYLDIYFSCVHIAYPFLCQEKFRARYEEFWSDGVDDIADLLWLSLMFTVFAIGANYTSFPGPHKNEVRKNLPFFEHASQYAQSMLFDCSLENVQLLVTQCIFLLITSQTDRCSNTLGLAIKIAQAIGLHLEDCFHASRSVSTTLDITEAEIRRRTWYTMYNMDRLLALQLGRPLTIHEGDYVVQLPSEPDHQRKFPDDNRQSEFKDSSSPLDFFISVIRFSQVLSRVVNDLYGPSRKRSHPDETLAITSALDEAILLWKADLPRHLRFDIAHIFENSVVYKRQRNMLAVKFHHLRALIHRPYLRLSIPQGAKGPQILFLEQGHSQATDKEKICILAAQQTARLLRDITDERSLVLNFPWWQMISCLLCAGSILAVASAMNNSDAFELDLDSQALEEDTEICIKVFDSLSMYSHAARRARDMLRSLKHCCIRSQESSHIPLQPQPLVSTTRENLTAEANFTASFPDVAWDFYTTEPFDATLPLLCYDWDNWPVAFSDPVSKSAQSFAEGSSIPLDVTLVSDGAPPALRESVKSFDFLR